MIVKINKEGWMEAPFVSDATEEIEVDEETNEKLSTFPFFHDWKYNRETKEWSLEIYDEDNWLRLCRKRKCFDILDNKSNMWYQMLTDKQNAELKTWYQAWLDVTDTKVQPSTPEWLKEN